MSIHQMESSSDVNSWRQKFVQNLFLTYYRNTIVLDLNGTNDYTSETVYLSNSILFKYRVITTKHLNVEHMVVLVQLCGFPPSTVKYEVRLCCEDLGLEHECYKVDNSWRVIWEGNLKGKKPYRLHALFYRLSIVPEPIPFINTLYNDTDLTDFELKGEDGSVRVHRAILAACSSKLQEKFRGQWRGKAEGFLDAAVQKTTLQHFKDFLYLRKLPDAGLGQLLLLARYYNIFELELMINDKIAGGSVPEGAIECFQVSGLDLYSLHDKVRSQLGKTKMTPYWQKDTSKPPRKLPILRFD